MEHAMFTIFKECFPNLPINEEVFKELIEDESNHYIRKCEEDELIGYSIVKDNHIMLLCVIPSHQNKGIGKELVKESEAFIKQNGFDIAILGAMNSRLFLGAVIEEKDWEEKHHAFFESCGYHNTGNFVEMQMPLKDVNVEELPVNLNPENITFGYCTDEEKSNLYEAVAQVDEEWVQYFKGSGSFYVAKEEDQIIGFTALSFDDMTLQSTGFNKVGNVGCVGVIPSKRKYGLGLTMVARSIAELKKHGVEIGYIHFTQLESWYAKLGYRTFCRFWFGSKELVKND